MRTLPLAARTATRTETQKEDSGRSSFSSSSSSSSSVILPRTTPRRNTMEEVWKEINMSTLGHYCHPSPPSLSSIETPLPRYKTADPVAHQSFHGMSLPDFLTGPFKDPRCSVATGEHHRLSLPPTALSLCSSGLVPDFDYQNFHSCLPASNSDSTCPGHVAAALVDPETGSHFLCSRKRVCDNPSSCNTGGDRRHKRMIKNRESAARSRARKQAYTNEMELEVAQLSEDNAKLKKQNEQLRSAMAAPQPKWKSLQKSFSALF